MPNDRDIITVVIDPMKEVDGGRSAIVRAAMSMYLGEGCRFCPGTFETHEELTTAVYAGYHARGRVAHKACWDALSDAARAEVVAEIEANRRKGGA